MAKDRFIETIQHYQRNLDRGVKEDDQEKILHCMRRLSNLPITVAHLEETGVGRTVNSMRKAEGKVGDAARTLVTKWKDMVSKTQDYEEGNDDDKETGRESSCRRSSESGSGSSENESSRKTTDDDEEEEEEMEKPPLKKSRKDLETYEKEKDTKSASYVKEKYKEASNLKRKCEESSDDEPSQKKSKYKSSSHHKTDREGKDKYRGSSSTDNKSREKYSSHKSKESSSGNKSRESSDHKSKHDHRNKESSSSHKSSSDSKIKETKNRESSTDFKSKEPSSHRNKETSSNHKSKESENRSKGADRKDSKLHDSDKRKSDKNKRDEERKRKSKETGKNDKVDTDYGIGSESGTTFAEALGMLEPSIKVSKKQSQERGVETEKKCKESKNGKSESSRDRGEASKDKRKSNKDHKSSPSKREAMYAEAAPKLEIVVPPPPPKNDLDINLSTLLPPITPNYKPMSNPIYDSFLNNRIQKPQNEDEALYYVMSQKNLRTKVYSGNKVVSGPLPRLFDLCIRVLQDNIDALEYTGGVPYSILKPVLDKATPQQLYMLEHHNPYLIEDTDEIWRFHCQKEFKGKRREEMESCRDMYLRCLDEREIKLKALTENIKQAQDKSIPLRQTKLAYVDNYVKPPREIARKQARNGIVGVPAVTPQARLNAIAAGSSGSAVTVPNPTRAAIASTSNVKPKKAPLMQKTLAFLKGGRFRR